MSEGIRPALTPDPLALVADLTSALEAAKKILDRSDAATLFDPNREWRYRQTFAHVCAALEKGRAALPPRETKKPEP